MLEEKLAQCPYCWESIYFEIDLSEPNQEYVEDCQVCCNPILLRISSLVTQLILKQLKRKLVFNEQSFPTSISNCNRFFRSLFCSSEYNFIFIC